MLRFYTAQSGRLAACAETEGGVFFSAAAPDEEELRRLSGACGFSPGLLRVAAAPDLQPRAEQAGDAALFCCAMPVAGHAGGTMTFRVLPFSVLFGRQKAAAVSPRGTPAAEDLLQTPFLPARRGGKMVYFFLQLLVQRFRLHLRQMEKMATYQQAGAARPGRMRDLLGLQGALAAYCEALRANESAVEKLSRLSCVAEEDRLLIEHVRMELRRAGESAAACARLVSGTIGAFASLSRARLVRTLRVFSVAVLLFAVSLLGYSAYGLGTHAASPSLFWVMAALSVLCMSSAALLLYQKRA